MVRSDVKDFNLNGSLAIKRLKYVFQMWRKFLELYSRDAAAGNSTRMNYFDTQFCRHLSFGVSMYGVPVFNSKMIDRQIALVCMYIYMYIVWDFNYQNINMRYIYSSKNILLKIATRKVLEYQTNEYKCITSVMKILPQNIANRCITIFVQLLL